jgi:hypothetical protein
MKMIPLKELLSSLVKSDVEKKMTSPRSRSRYSLTFLFNTSELAWGCDAEYLPGAASCDKKDINSFEFNRLE